VATICVWKVAYIMPFARDRISLAVSGWRTWGWMFGVTNHCETASYLLLPLAVEAKAPEPVHIFETLVAITFSFSVELLG
jgi:hypothetical protein